MNQAVIEQIEAKLRERKNALLARIAEVKQDLRSEHSADWSEQAQERQNDEVLDAIGNESRQELNDVSLALERIADGEYTICAECGDDINIERLKAVPYTNLCIKCAEAAS